MKSSNLHSAITNTNGLEFFKSGILNGTLTKLLESTHDKAFIDHETQFVGSFFPETDIFTAKEETRMRTHGSWLIRMNDPELDIGHIDSFFSGEVGAKNNSNHHVCFFLGHGQIQIGGTSESSELKHHSYFQFQNYSDETDQFHFDGWKMTSEEFQSLYMSHL